MSDSSSTVDNLDHPPPKQRKPWREWISKGLSLIAIGWLSCTIITLGVLYQYAWQLGRYPNPIAPHNAAHGSWYHESFLQEGVRSLFSPPVYALFFAILSLLVKPSQLAVVLLGLSVIFFFIAFGHISLLD